MTPHRINKLVAGRQAISKKIITKTVRKNPTQLRGQTSPLPPKQLMVDDDPPEALPHFYKSPVHLVREGDEIEVWWEGDEKFYPGIARNLRGDGRRRVEYADGQVMYHDLKRELFILSGNSLERFLANKFPEALENHPGDRPVHFPALSNLVCVGDTVQVYWENNKSYYPGFVTGQRGDGWCSISYDVGDKGPVRFSDSVFRFVGMSAARAYSALL